MEIKNEDIVATYLLDDGSKYIFLENKTIYKQNKDGSLIILEINENNIKKMKEEIGEVPTDFIL